MGLTDTAGKVMKCPDRSSSSSSLSELEEERNVCTSIFYMLTKEENIGYWHMNTSDIVHYFHGGMFIT